MPVENKHRDLVVTRVVDAPVGQVWQAWTDPELVMRSPAGQDLYNTWSYRSIVPLQRLAFIQNFADEHGNKSLRPASGCLQRFPRTSATSSRSRPWASTAPR
jgi:uncharacterized protein YndB with AHSA1/START domain